MNKIFNRTILSMAIAIFSMFFGAGNAIFPLLLGKEAAGQVIWAFLGLLLTGIAGPLLGLLGATLFKGKIVDFFSKAGKFPGAILIIVSLALLGPFAALPRCVIVAHSAIKPLSSSFPLPLFSIFFCLLTLVLAWKKSFILPALSYILSPLLIGFLLLIIFKGSSLGSFAVPAATLSSWKAFTMGVTTGYNTMDLIASIYFSAGIWTMIEMQNKKATSKEVVKTTLVSGFLGCFLLALIYFGLILTAASNSHLLNHILPQELMTHLANLVLGPLLGSVANIAIALACLTTVISLTMTISQILYIEILDKKISYQKLILLNVLITAIFANLGFATIMQIIFPIISICYPIIIGLTIMNILKKTYFSKEKVN